jgi:hypothetical protein
MVRCCCHKLVAKAGDNSVTQRKGNVRVLEAATKQRIKMIVTDWEDLVCPIVICEVQ